MTEKQGGCKYCDGFPLPFRAWDVDAFTEGVEAYVERKTIVIEKYDGELRIKAMFCPMCGKEL